MKGEPVPVEQELRIDLPVKAFVPPGWVGAGSAASRAVPAHLARPDHATLDQIRAETIDRYGALPDEVDTCSRSRRCA